MRDDTTPDRLVVIGNGPSLRGFDFRSLAGAATLGMNAAYRYWDRVCWYPEIYSCLDDELIETHWREIKRLLDDGLVKQAFLSGHYARRVPESVDDSRCFFLDSYVKHWYNRRGRFLGLQFVGHSVWESSSPSKLTTGSHAVRFGIMSGYKRIALMGIDLKYVQQIPESRPMGGIKLQMVETPKHNPNYFFDDYQQAGDRFQVPDPVAHDGNLHLASFEALRNDSISHNWNVEIVNTSLRSALHDSGVFPYQPLAKFLGHSLLSAVIVPTRAAERSAILDNLWLWDQPEYAPFLHLRDRIPPKLVFYFNNEEGRPLESEIVEAFNSTNTLKRCFSCVECRFLSLSGENDVYVRSGAQKVGKLGYKAGPNRQFFEIISAAGEFGSHILYMETDCVPIRPDWLGQIQDIVQSAEPFWVLGSVYRGQGVLEKAFSRHINGNAVYAVGDAGFQEFVADVWQPVLNGITARDPSYAYDQVVETIFDGAKSNCVNDRVWRMTQSILHKWRATEVIQNHSGPVDGRDSVAELVRSVLVTSSSTYLLHGQVFVGAVRQLRQRGGGRWTEAVDTVDLKVAGHSVQMPASSPPADSGPGQSPNAAADEFLDRYMAARDDYERLVLAIRDYVDAHLPASATLAIVSKGDENMRSLGGRLVWHFPSTPDGLYAGHYPADDAAAIEHLEVLRKKGSEFLVLPRTAFWWLKHYPEFGRHLVFNYQAQVLPERIAVIFDLKRTKSECVRSSPVQASNEDRWCGELPLGNGADPLEIESILEWLEKQA